jgi:hypothetical protein
LWVVLAVLLVGTGGLAGGVWWGRLVPLAWSTSLAALSPVALYQGMPAAPYILAIALLLRICVGGKEMFARYEGQAPPSLDWTRPPMRLVRAALIANLWAFLGSVAFAPAIYRWNRGILHPHLAGPDPAALLAGCLVMTAIMLVGLVLLARQRTVGLLLLAVSAVCTPIFLVANLAVLDRISVLILSITFVPGIVCGWLALARFVPGMVRLLRR